MAAAAVAAATAAFIIAAAAAAVAVGLGDEDDDDDELLLVFVTGVADCGVSGSDGGVLFCCCRTPEFNTGDEDVDDVDDDADDFSRSSINANGCWDVEVVSG